MIGVVTKEQLGYRRVAESGVCGETEIIRMERKSFKSAWGNSAR